MVQIAGKCWKSSLICLFSFLDKEGAAEIYPDFTKIHDFTGQYYFELKSKEVDALLAFIEVAFLKYLEEVWKFEI